MHDIGRYALSALWVFGLLAAFLWWLNKKRGVPFAKHLDKRIQILEVYPMGLKNKMMLVQVDDQRMLLSMNTQDIRTLHAWTTPPKEPSCESPLAQAKDTSQSPIPGLEHPISHFESTSQS
jgi:flagellar biogenesis protein FliO